MDEGLTRRDLLRTGAAAGIGAAASGLALDPVIERALASTGRPGRLRDIEHVVILIQENRSFDHYFGTYRGVRGFADRHGRAAFAQHGYTQPGQGGRLRPFHLETHGQAQCTNDITHDWGPQHRSWNHGRMDRFLREHLKSDDPGSAPLTMGYYQRSDIEFYYRLADAFTICDRYHCSVMGPTDPNRLYTMSATIDPDGRHGGPLLETLVTKRAANAGKFRWTTMPEQLSERRVSWKVYTSPVGGSFDNVLPYFRNFQHKKALNDRGIKPTYPADFAADLKRGRLPQVSWIIGSLPASEHPGFSSAKGGERITRDVLSALTAHPEVWKKTALFVTWDENGGFFDHVAPPAPRHGTRGEYLTIKTLPDTAQGIRGPIGLGFRVPMLIASPFARGGYVCSDLFDHTSVLRFLETRFGAEVPNLSAWRRSVTGDLTSAFSFARPDRSVPRLPRVNVPSDSSGASCSSEPYPVPANHMPGQEHGRPRRPRHS